MNLIFALLVSLTTFAHEGHDDGPIGIATGKYGGLVEGIVEKADKARFHDAIQLGKAELVRSADGTTRVYIYDSKMKKVDLSHLAPKGYAIVEWGKGQSSRITLEKSKKAFIGQLPRVTPPYAIEIYLKNKDVEIFTEFENLD